MANEVRVASRLDDGISGGLTRIRDRIDLLGKGMTSASIIGNTGAMLLEKGINLVGQAAGRAVDFIGDSIQAASNLTEATTKSQVVFQEAADDVLAWSKTTAEGFGISQRAALEAAGTYGNFFVGLGKTGEEAALMSKRLVELAADLGSFNNIDVTEMLTKLRSGLAGEAEPLRRVGVFLTEAKVRAKAMEMGLADAHGELSEGAKVLARYRIILDETGTAQGDFARTSEGLANTQKTSNAKIEEAMARVGAHMEGLAARTVPLLADAMGVLATAVDGAAFAIESMAGPAQKLTQSGTDEYWYLLTDGAKEAAASIDRASAAHTGAIAKMSRAMLDEGIPAVEDQEEAVKGYTYTIDKAARRTDFDAASIARSIEGMRDKVVSAMQSVIDDAYDPAILAYQIQVAQYEVANARKEASAKGLTAAERAEANLRLAEARKHLESLLAEQARHGDAAAQLAYIKGQFTTAQMAAGLASNDPLVRAHWNTLREEMERLMAQVERSAYSGGRNVSYSWANGLEAGYKYAYSLTYSYMSKMSNLIMGSSPPPEGPLRTIDRGGENVGRAWAEGFAKGLNGDVTSPLQRLAGLLAAGSPGAGGLTTAMGAIGGGPLSSPLPPIHLYIDGREVQVAVDRQGYYGRGARGLLPS